MVSYFLLGDGFWSLRVSSMPNGAQGHPLSGHVKATLGPHAAGRLHPGL